MTWEGPGNLLLMNIKRHIVVSGSRGHESGPEVATQESVMDHVEQRAGMSGTTVSTYDAVRGVVA